MIPLVDWIRAAHLAKVCNIKWGYQPHRHQGRTMTDRNPEARPEAGTETDDLTTRARRVLAKLGKKQRLIVARTSDTYDAAPWIDLRPVPWGRMAHLRDTHDVVEDGMGLWRRTDLGREVHRIATEPTP